MQVINKKEGKVVTKMGIGVFISVFLHFGLVAIAYFGIPSLRHDVMAEAPILVEILTAIILNKEDTFDYQTANATIYDILYPKDELGRPFVELKDSVYFGAFKDWRIGLQLRSNLPWLRPNQEGVYDADAKEQTVRLK